MTEKELNLFMINVDEKPLPKRWNEFVDKITINHNVIYKNRDICKCTNCNKSFATGKIKIGDIATCPHCKNKYSVMGGYLYYRGQSFEESVVVCQRINKQIVFRVIEICTYFNRLTDEMITSTQEYARIIAGVGTFLSNATFFFMGHQHIYHNEKNTYWRKYDGVRNFLSFKFYPYNKARLIEGTKMAYAPIKEFLEENLDYNYCEAVNLAAYPNFESMWKMGLKNLSRYSYMFKKTGSFQQVFGLPKNLLPFMVENDIGYRDYSVLKVIKEPNAYALEKFHHVNLNKLRKLNKQISVTKHIDACSIILKAYQPDLDHVLRYVKLKKLIKYKELPNNFSIYKDYLIFIEKLGFDMTNTKYLFPKNLLELHDKFSKEVEVKENLLIESKISERFLDLSNFIYEDKQYIIYPAPCYKSFEEESKMQGNCVRQYAEDYSNGITEIYFMRNLDDISNSLVTLEYKEGKVIQKEQKNHSSPTQEQNDFIKKWVRYRKNKRNVKFELPTRTLIVA